MIFPLVPIALGVLAWAGNKAIPAVWHHHIDRQAQQIELAKDLCSNHGDCEAEKIQALQGMKKVVRLEGVPAGAEPSIPEMAK